MNYKAYILTFDKGKVLDPFDYKKFHDSLTSGAGILDWWHYLEGTYIIITESNNSSLAVANFVRQLMPDKLFFVSELNLANHNGWLPLEAWNWINKYNGILSTN